MRSLNRNKRPMYYALRIGEVVNVDEYGNETGERTPEYGDVTEFRCNVSATSGEDVVRAFGNFADYTRIVCVADPHCTIDEDSIIWFGVEPTEPNNYIVTSKADSKNGVLYALKEVAVRQ